MCMSIAKFESMLKTNDVYFFDAVEFENIIDHYITTGKHALAKKAVKLGLNQHPYSIQLKLLKVEILVFENQITQAVELLTQIEALEPNNEEVFIQKATILSKNQKHIEAVDMLKKSLEFVQDPVDVWAMIGMEYLYMEDFESARLNFAKCIDVDYEDYSSLYNIVYCFEMQNDFKGAINFLESYIDKNPYCEVAWHQLGRQYLEVKELEQALRAFDYAVIIDESFIGGYLEKAKTLEELEMYELAIENYMITLQLDDPTAYAYLKIGDCFEKLKDFSKAIKNYKLALIEDPLLDKALLMLTDVYYKKGNYPKALHYLNRAIEIDESNPVLWRNYAEINIKLNFYEEAMKAFNTCIDLGDISLEVYLAMSDVLLYIGDINDAIAVLVKAKAFFNEVAEIEYRLFGLFFLLNQKKNSFLHLKTALNIDPGYCNLVKDLFPTVFNNDEVKKLLITH